MSKVPSLEDILRIDNHSSKSHGNDIKEEEQLSKLEREILKVQQQMAEGDDHIRYEMKMKEV